MTRPRHTDNNNNYIDHAAIEFMLDIATNARLKQQQQHKQAKQNQKRGGNSNNKNAAKRTTLRQPTPPILPLEYSVHDPQFLASLIHIGATAAAATAPSPSPLSRELYDQDVITVSACLLDVFHEQYSRNALAIAYGRPPMKHKTTTTAAMTATPPDVSVNHDLLKARLTLVEERWGDCLTMDGITFRQRVAAVLLVDTAVLRRLVNDNNNNNYSLSFKYTLDRILQSQLSRTVLPLGVALAGCKYYRDEIIDTDSSDGERMIKDCDLTSPDSLVDDSIAMLRMLHRRGNNNTNLPKSKESTSTGGAKKKNNNNNKPDDNDGGGGGGERQMTLNIASLKNFVYELSNKTECDDNNSDPRVRSHMDELDSLLHEPYVIHIDKDTGISTSQTLFDMLFHKLKGCDLIAAVVLFQLCRVHMHVVRNGTPTHGTTHPKNVFGTGEEGGIPNPLFECKSCYHAHHAFESWKEQQLESAFPSHLQPSSSSSTSQPQAATSLNNNLPKTRHRWNAARLKLDTILQARYDKRICPVCYHHIVFTFLAKLSLRLIEITEHMVVCMACRPPKATHESADAADAVDPVGHFSRWLVKSVFADIAETLENESALVMRAIEASSDKSDSSSSSSRVKVRGVDRPSTYCFGNSTVERVISTKTRHSVIARMGLLYTKMSTQYPFVDIHKLALVIWSRLYVHAVANYAEMSNLCTKQPSPSTTTTPHDDVVVACCYNKKHLPTLQFLKSIAQCRWVFSACCGSNGSNNIQQHIRDIQNRVDTLLLLPPLMQQPHPQSPSSLNFSQDWTMQTPMNIVKKSLTAGYIAIGAKLNGTNVNALRRMNVTCETYVNDMRLSSITNDTVEHSKIHERLMRVMANMSHLQTEDMIQTMAYLAHSNPAFIASIVTCGMEVMTTTTSPTTNTYETDDDDSPPPLVEVNTVCTPSPSSAMSSLSDADDSSMLEYVLLSIGIIMTDAIVPFAAVSPLLLLSGQSSASYSPTNTMKRGTNLDELVTATFRDLPQSSSSSRTNTTTTTVSLNPPFLPVFTLRSP